MYSETYPHIQWSEEDRKEIESNAYFRWIDAGCPSGDGKHFWEEAEQDKFIKLFFPTIDTKPMPPEEEVIELNYHAPKFLNKIKTGWLGDSLMDSGYFYTPYGYNI